MKSPEAIHYREVSLVVNGQAIRRRVATHQRLLDFLRDDLGLMGTKEVCGEGECGACTVFLNGETVNSCLIFTVEAEGTEIVTIEGLTAGAGLTPLQQAFVDQHAVQCGYCIPGMILSGEQLLRENPAPEKEAIQESLAGNMCRCTGYQKIVAAVAAVGRK